jgi:hypothetical protein
MTQWPLYLKRFQEEYEHLKGDLLELGSVECRGGPLVKPTDMRHPNEAPWRVDWAVVYPNGKYFRVKESFRRYGFPQGSGKREHFSFHYGVPHPDCDARGFPKSRPDDNPPLADLRIDLDKDLKPHIHVHSGEHIYQDRVVGFDIENADKVLFLEAVIQHRKTGVPLTELLKIKVL